MAMKLSDANTTYRACIGPLQSLSMHVLADPFFWFAQAGCLAALFSMVLLALFILELVNSRAHAIFPDRQPRCMLQLIYQVDLEVYLAKTFGSASSIANLAEEPHTAS